MKDEQGPRYLELMELTRKIVEQNELILKINAQLLTLLSMPMMEFKEN